VPAILAGTESVPEASEHAMTPRPAETSNRPTAAGRRGRPLTVVVALPAALLMTAAPAPAQTPQSLPGLVIATPPPAPAGIPGAVVVPHPGSTPAPAAQPPQPAQPVPPPPAAAAKPKPKPKPKQATASAAPVGGEGSGSTGTGTGGGSGQAIRVLVNDDPITGYEIEQRARLNALSSNIGERASETFKRMVQQESTNQRLKQILEETIRANPGKSREEVLAAFEVRKKEFAQGLQRQAVESARASVIPGLKKAAQEELIEERLKIQEARRGNVSIDAAEVDRIVRGIAERNKMNEKQFAEHLRGMGADITSMKARFRAQLAWNEVVRRRFSAQVAVNERDIERFVAQSGEVEDQVDLHLQRVVFAVPGKLDQRVVAQRLEAAEALRRAFGGCKTTAALAAKSEGAKFEDLGVRKPSAITEPTRSLLIAAKEGEMVPPSVGAGGVELFAVCSRKVVKASDQKREHAQQELRQKEFEILAKRHLRDLRNDAHIEFR
jgi:peptidyl-prolyl cis-trans isomerase SurA